MATCRCGREISKVPHCYTCGSLNVYAVRRLGFWEVVDGKVEHYRGFRCRHCDTQFTDKDNCEAPAARILSPETVSRMAARKALAATAGQSDRDIIIKEATRIFREEAKKKAEAGDDPDDFDPKKLQ